MSWYRDFKRIAKDNSFVLTLFALILLISPGLATISIYFPQALVNLDWVKLVLLSLCITTPIAIFNTIMLDVFMESSKRTGDSIFWQFVMSACITGLFIYLWLGSVYSLSLYHKTIFDFSHSNEIVCGLLYEAIFAVMSWIEFRKK